VQNKPIKKIFVCEFITGGGLCAAHLSESLTHEGALMRDSLLRDLSELPYSVSTTVDARLNAPKNCAECFVVQADDDVWQIWKAQVKAADAVFIIAPETDGTLHYLTQMAGLESAQVLGCGLNSIAIASDKMATYLALEAANIATIPTYTLENWPKSHWIWLAKPNDGVGCSDTACFNNADDLQDWIVRNDKQLTHVIQAYQPGDSASISCVMKKGKAHVLSCNTQEIEINNHMLSYKGGIVNGMREHWQQFELVANQVAKALPDLAGYVGIDVIVDDGNIGADEIIVVEINPRLTTSYIALREATGKNPAELIINTLTNPRAKWPKLQQNQVRIDV
jgi:predicted ATP-grasp superfamily ATP-dependent carboligase